MSDKKPIHPNSLANLAPPFTKENASNAGKRGAAVKWANKEARLAAKMSINEWKNWKKDVLDETELSAVDVMKILMVKALDREDFDTAAELASKLAEFETPKLQRIETKVEEMGADDLTDDELEAKLKELLDGKDDSD